MPSHIPSRIKGLMILSFIVFCYYARTYILTLENFGETANLPFIESARYLYLTGKGDEAGVFTAHPDLLATYYKGPVYKLPERGGFEEILREAKERGVRYLIIESTCISSKELIDLYYHSIDPSWRRVPSEFQLVRVERWVYGLYLIGPEEKQQVWFKAAIFSRSQCGIWETMLASMGGLISTFNDTTIISSIDLSEFDVVVFDDFVRPLSNAERLHLEESIRNGLIAIVSGLSPYYLAGGKTNLASISSWLGASVFSEAPKEARWKVKFTEDAKEIMKDLDLDREYAFYGDADWSTPIGCLVQPESVVYAYRVNDQVATIFSHKFGKGATIFNGPRHGFVSPDLPTFIPFLRALICSVLA